jgi:hypothetical protein
MPNTAISPTDHSTYRAFVNEVLASPQPAVDVLGDQAGSIMRTLSDPYATAYLIGCCGVADAAARVIQIIDALPLHDAMHDTAATACFIKGFAYLALDEEVDAFCFLTAALGFNPNHIPSRWLMAALDTGIPDIVIQRLGLTMFRALAVEER